MAWGGPYLLTWAVVISWVFSLSPKVFGSFTPFLPQGFFFSWTPSDQSPPVPTTAQCETLHLSWSRSTATGPNPTAPYSLQVFTSAFIVPLSIAAGGPTDLTFDWAVPWIPGTQYQICMWDANGVSGGCQATYTVYQAPNHTVANPPSCANVTYPREDQVLGVDAQVDNGPMSQYGWVDQCTDISLTPKNGTPPYTMTIAPALHPPYNITSHTMNPINWTVSLSWGMPFFISLVDSTGMSWANGPLHSGGGGTTECLSEEARAASSSGHKVQPWVAGVSGVAGVIFGLLVGLLGAIWIARRARKQSILRPDPFHRKSSSTSMTIPTVLPSLPNESHRNAPSLPPVVGQPPNAGVSPSGVASAPAIPPPIANVSSADSSANRILAHAPSRHFESFVFPRDAESGARTIPPTSAAGTHDAMSGPHGQSTHDLERSPSGGTTAQILSRSPSDASTAPGTDEVRSAMSHVYVVHHDAGRPPVTVYTSDGTEVVELPPRYNESESPEPPQPPQPSRDRPDTSSSRAQEGQAGQAAVPKPAPVRRVVNE